MKVFTKYVLKSMTEKKGRFSLLIIAIAVSTALVVASTGLIDIILDSLVKPQLETFENKDIQIDPTDPSSSFFKVDGLSYDGIKEESLVKELYINASIIDQVDTDDETILNVIVRGKHAEDVHSEMIIEGNLSDYSDATCIISERIAKERNLKLGDNIDVIIGGMTKSLKICAISAVSGVFYNDTAVSFALVLPYEYLSHDLGVEGQYNILLANSANTDIDIGIKQFNEANKDFEAKMLYDEDVFKAQTSEISSILYVMLLIVVVMSAIIIYSSFKLIITERLSTVGTFLSQGATTSKVKFIFRLESILYGIIGAIFGNVLGVIGLHIINRMVSPLKDYGIYESVTIKPTYIIAGTIFAIVLSIVSAFLPVRKISKLEVKNIILNDVRIEMKIGYKKFLIGSLLLVVSILLYAVGACSNSLILAFSLIGSITGLILAYPKLIDIVSGLLFHVLRGKSKNIIFAVNNLRTSKILMGNITLLIVSLFSIISITSIGTSMISIITDVYTELNYDIEISNISTLRENSEESVTDYVIQKLKEIGIQEEDINPITGLFGSFNSHDKNNIINMGVLGIDVDQYIEYNEYLDLGRSSYEDYIKNFKSDPKGIIITTALNERLNKKIGDQIALMCNGVEKELTINGIINAALLNNGYLVFVKNETLVEEFYTVSSNTLTFTTNLNLEDVEKDLKPIMREIGASYITKEQMCNDNIEQNQMMVDALSIFSYMAIIIAALGIINNISISFLQRKNEFAVLSSVGMQNSGRNRILLFESITSVTWAMIFTSLYCIFGMKLITDLFSLIGMEMTLLLDYSSLPMIYIVSLCIVLLATIPVFFKSRKLSIIEELKYE